MSTTKLVKSVNVYNINKFIILISLKSIRATLYFLVKIIAWNSKAKYIVKDIVTESWVIILFFQLHVIHVVDNLTMHFPMFSKLFVGECTCAFELVGWNVTQCFWRKVICITLFCYYFPLKKGLALLNKIELLPTKDALCQVWLKLDERIRIGKKNVVNFTIIPPW